MAGRIGWMAAGGAASAWLLAGCAAIAPATVDVQQSAASVLHASLAGPAVSDAIVRAGLSAPEEGDAWNLDALMVAAWTLRPELAEARLLHTAATADAASAAKSLNPTFSLIPEFARGAAGASPWTVAAALSFMIVNPAVRDARVDRARAQLLLARWQYADVAWRITSEVRQAWRTLGAVHRALHLGEQVDLLAEERAALASRRFDAGAIGRGELARAQALRSQSAFALQGARRLQSDARFQLASALGVPVDELARVDLAAIPALPILQRDAEEDTQAALFNRIDLAQALTHHAQADAALRESMASRFPGLSIAPGYTFDRGDRKWVLGLAAELPLFDNKDSAIAALAARRQASVRAVESVQALALAQVSRALADLTDIQSALGLADAAIATQQHAIAVSVRRSQAGLAEGDTLLDVRAQLLMLQQSKLDLEGQQIAALGALESAMQTPAWPLSAVQPIALVASSEATGALDVARN